MIKYLKSLADKFMKASPVKKALAVFLALVYLLALFSVIVKVNVVVVTPGTLNGTAYTKASEKPVGAVKIETDNKPGAIYTIGVYSHIRVTYFQHLISRLSRDIDVDDYNPGADLSKREEIIRGEIHREFAMQHALIVAYEEAAKVDESIHIEYDFKGLIVSAVFPGSKSNLEPRDFITHINGTKIAGISDFSTRLAGITGNTAFTLTILRQDKGEYAEKNVSAQKTLYDGDYKLGVELQEYYVIDKEKTTPKFTIAERMPSLGSSGGAMTALAIYNSLIEEDITDGKIICGTGTINVDGKVGAIGGIEQKIVTAQLYNVEVFFVDEYDYEAAKAKYDEIKADFQLISVAEFADIIAALRGDTDE